MELLQTHNLSNLFLYSIDGKLLREYFGGESKFYGLPLDDKHYIFVTDVENDYTASWQQPTPIIEHYVLDTKTNTVLGKYDPTHIKSFDIFESPTIIIGVEDGNTIIYYSIYKYY